ncbi:MAG: hypothetical protein IMZ61_07805 [Planctomycetes bacterium]|nr:hypothetical protein [Planctomycetota bacterium]
MRTLRKLWNKIIKNYWQPIQCLWPDPDGWACWNKFKHTSIDHGQPTKTAAQILCNKLNKDLK